MEVVRMTTDIDEGQGLTATGIADRTVPKSFAKKEKKKGSCTS